MLSGSLKEMWTLMNARSAPYPSLFPTGVVSRIVSVSSTAFLIWARYEQKQHYRVRQAKMWIVRMGKKKGEIPPGSSLELKGLRCLPWLICCTSAGLAHQRQWDLPKSPHHTSACTSPHRYLQETMWDSCWTRSGSAHEAGIIFQP